MDTEYDLKVNERAKNILILAMRKLRHLLILKSQIEMTFQISD